MVRMLPAAVRYAFVGHLSGRAEVGGGADSLEDAGGRDELGDAGDSEGVGTLLSRRDVRCLQCSGEKLHMRRLVRADRVHVLVERRVEASVCKVLLRVVGETFSVELVF